MNPSFGCVCVCVCACVRACVCVCVRVSAVIHTYIHTYTICTYNRSSLHNYIVQTTRNHCFSLTTLVVRESATNANGCMLLYVVQYLFYSRIYAF